MACWLMILHLKAGGGALWRGGHGVAAAVMVCHVQMRNLPILEMGGPFPVMVPLPEVRNHISGTALTVCFFVFWLGCMFSHERV